MWPFTRRRDFEELERRDYVDLSAFTKFGDIAHVGNTASGMTVTEIAALNLPVVYTCINLNSQVISSLPVDCLARRGEARVPSKRPFWLERPNDEQDWGEFIAQVLVSRYQDGNAFIFKAVTGDGRLAGLWVLNPLTVRVERQSLGGRLQLVYRVRSSAGGETVLGSNEVMHVKGMTPPGQLRGLSPIICAAEALGIYAAAERYNANFYGNSAILSGVIESPTSMTKEQADRLQESFRTRHGGISKSHALGILSGGAQFKPLSVTPDDALALDTMKLTGVQIAHLFGCPSYMVTADTEGAKGYVTGLLASRYDWYTTGLQPEIVRLERAFSALLPGPAFIRFNMRAFLRGDAAETAAQMTAEIQNAVRSPEEWRTVLDYEPSGMPTRYYIQGGTFVLDANGAPVPSKKEAAPAAPAADDAAEEESQMRPDREDGQ